MAYKMVNRLDWFDARGNPLLVSSGPVHTTPRYSWLRPHHESALHPDGELQYFKESEVAYLDVTATRDRVYALSVVAHSRDPKLALFKSSRGTASFLARSFLTGPPGRSRLHRTTGR